MSDSEPIQLSDRRRRDRPTPQSFRDRLLFHMRLRLEERRNPRLVMAFVVGLAAIVGFYSSMTLLHLGMSSMALRYPLALGLAYLAFLLLVRYWLMRELELGRREWMEATNGLAATQSETLLPSERPDLEAMGARHGGAAPFRRKPPRRRRSSSLDVDPGILDFFGLDEWGYVALILIAAACSILIACFYIVWTAPVLLAEVLLDGIVAAGVYQRVAKLPVEGWPTNLLKRTWFAVVVAVVFCLAAGWVAQSAFPEAQSIGAVLGEAL